MSNTWVIFARARDNPAKVGLIPDKTTWRKLRGRRWLFLRIELSLEDEPMAYQLVGGVKAHQGYDG